MTGEKKELMLRIIDLCESVRQRGMDPFDVKVQEFLDRLRELLPKLKAHEDLYLDIEAMLGLAEVVYQQGEWIKHKSSLLYLDPLLIMLKLHALSSEDLSDILMRSWHPIVELESISPHGIKESRDYWTELPPLSERWGGLETTELLTGKISRSELEKMGVSSEEDFSKLMKEISEELQSAVGEKGEINYWDFIMARTFEETTKRAWLVSFLVTGGYATIDVMPLEEEIILRPLAKPRGLKTTEVFSLAIPITREEWERRKNGGEN